jgi:RNA polymerase-associated protein CTR9
MRSAFQSNDSSSSLPPIYSLLANIQIAYARKAPKLKLSDARKFISWNLDQEIDCGTTA